MHVLSLPPAFVLSQDQTLRFKESVLALVATLTRSKHKSPRSCAEAHAQSHWLRTENVDVPRSLDQPVGLPTNRPARTPPSTFPFLQSRCQSAGGRRKATADSRGESETPSAAAFRRSRDVVLGPPGDEDDMIPHSGPAVNLVRGSQQPSRPLPSGPWRRCGGLYGSSPFRVNPPTDLS